jgi:hypothetical protein
MKTILRSLALSAIACAALSATPAAAHPHGGYYGPQPPRPRAERGVIGGALRLGVDTPSGSIQVGQRMRDEFDPQVGILGELGVRVTPQLLLGGYLGVGFGSPGARFDAACDFGDCGAASFRVGLMAQVDLAPGASVSPWIGYGFGLTAAATGGDDAVDDFSTSYTGIELGRLMFGLDFRPGGIVGLGLYADWTFGVFRRFEEEQAGITVADGRIRDGTVFHWFSVGPRLSF